jgi:hypothetical protein
VAKAFEDAVNSKRRDLRARTDNAARGIAAPERGERKANVYLYPSEAVALLACEDVPLRWRRFFALSMFLPWGSKDRKLSRQIQRCMRLAGLTRADLYASDRARKPMTFYDLRATGITWCAVRGDDPLRIKQRAGHRIFSTTEIYIREAENLGASDFGTPFPPLPESLLRSTERSTESHAENAATQKKTGPRLSPQSRQWTRWSPIRTAGEVVVEFVVMPRGEMVWQRVEGEVRRLRGLGMTLQAIGRALGVDEKTVRNVLAR